MFVSGPKHPSGKKAKTLAEKRELLREEVMKYGVAAIEKMYPRQNFNQSPPKKIVPKGVRGTPVKMKPKPHGLGQYSDNLPMVVLIFDHKHFKHKFDLKSLRFSTVTKKCCD